MKISSQQRDIYYELNQLVSCGLCSCCKFSQNDGTSICEGDGLMECKHPLEKVRDIDEDSEVQAGDADCWGFRPAISVSDWADIIGLILEKGWDRWQWYVSKTNRIHIEGLVSR